MSSSAKKHENQQRKSGREVTPTGGQKFSTTSLQNFLTGSHFFAEEKFLYMEEAISALASGQYSLAVQRLGFHGNTPNTKKSRISKITIRNLHLQNNIRTINSMRCFSKKAYKYFRGIFMMYSPKKKRFLC